MRESIYNHIKAVSALAPTAISTNGHHEGTSISLDQNNADFRVASLVVQAATITDGTYTVVPQESATGSGGWENVPASRVQGSAVIDATGQIGEVGIIPNPALFPHLRVRITAATVTTGGTVAAIMLLGSPSSTPIARP